MEAFTVAKYSKNRMTIGGKRKLSSVQSSFTSYWDLLPEELRQQIQWMADFQHTEDRLIDKGWEDIHEAFDPCGNCGLFKLYESSRYHG